MNCVPGLFQIRKVCFREAGEERSEICLREIGQNVDIICEPGLSKCSAGPRAAYRETNSGPLERGAQGSEGFMVGYHCRRYALAASSVPYLVAAILKLISVSSA